jgi:aspartate beta-hydroxylase
MSSNPSSSADVKSVIEAADRAAASGNDQEAARLIAHAQLTAPDHPLVLNALGMRALKNGNAEAARHLLQRAAEADSNTPTLWLHLAMACRAAKDGDAELAAVERALALDPYFYLAHLQKATYLERRGDSKQAAASFHAFLSCVPSSGAIPAPLQSAIARARAALAANAAALEVYLHERLQDKFEPDNAEQRRFQVCLDVLLGKKRVYVQQPTFMHFPELPAIQFYRREDFPWLDALEAATEEIREELVQLLSSDAHTLVPYISKAEGTPLNQWKELNNSRRWGASYFWLEGQEVKENAARCPRTAAALRRVPMADVPGHAPSAFFSVLEPHTRIPPHTGVTNTRLVVHLPLVIPPSCGFRVGNEMRAWQPGKAWVFDDSIEHEAWNESDEPRAILIVDIWNPFLSSEERDLVRIATQGVGDYYKQSGA